MKTLILLILGLGLSGCATVGSGLDYLSGNDKTYVWQVPTGKMDQFRADQSACYQFAADRPFAGNRYDQCLQLKGWKLELVKN